MVAQFMNMIALPPTVHSRQRTSPNKVMPIVGLMAIAGLVTIALCGCSNSAEGTDTKAARQVGAHLSAEQCETGAQIQLAAAKSSADGSYVIQPGDQVSLDFYLNPEFNDEITVRPDGKVTLRLVGDVQAAGLTPEQFAQVLDKDYAAELRNPDAAVHVKNMPSRQVYVQGTVNKPGAFVLEPGMTALQAISEAGGLTDEASDGAILIRRDACGQPYGMKIDLASASGRPGSGQDVALAPRDIIVVPRSGIASADLFVKQYIQGLLPFPPYMSFAAPAM